MKLIFPVEILKQHMAFLGKTGAGKSSAMRHVVEYLLNQGKRVCIIDPKGDWWGLKSSADGKSAGYPVIAFGDFKEPKAQDVPINAQSGKHVAELITSGNRPCIIGFRGWITSHMVKFWIDFASTLFNANSGELYLVGDEFHNFAPKGKIMDPEAGKCLHWSNRLMSEGRGYGLVCLIASQRPQKVHNDTLTCCETLVAMRVIHAADRGAVKEWIDGCGDMAQGREVLDNLAGMARGEAYVWSPEIGFGPKRVTFPMFGTFDSFAPPQLQKKIVTAGWADVNLDEVKEKMAAVIEETKANDPAELKKKIREMEKELAVKLPAVKQVTQEIVEVSVLTNEDRALILTIKEAHEHVVKWGQKLLPIMDKVLSSWSRHPAQLPRQFQNPPAKMRTLTPTAQSNGDLGRCERAILTALAQYPKGRTAIQVALLSEYSASSGGFNNSLGKLRSAGYITRGQPIQITTEGAAALGEWDPLPEGRELVERWIKRSGRCEATIISKLLEVYPNGMNPDELGEATGYAPTSGGFNNSLGRLRTLEVITRGRPITLNPDLFQ